MTIYQRHVCVSEVGGRAAGSPAALAMVVHAEGARVLQPGSDRAQPCRAARRKQTAPARASECVGCNGLGTVVVLSLVMVLLFNVWYWLRKARSFCKSIWRAQPCRASVLVVAFLSVEGFVRHVKFIIGTHEIAHFCHERTFCHRPSQPTAGAACDSRMHSRVYPCPVQRSLCDKLKAFSHLIRTAEVAAAVAAARDLAMSNDFCVPSRNTPKISVTLFFFAGIYALKSLFGDIFLQFQIISNNLTFLYCTGQKSLGCVQ